MQEECRYCTGDICPYSESGIIGTTEYVQTGEWDSFNDEITTIRREILFCPMCGRKLKEEEKAENEK